MEQGVGGGGAACPRCGGALQWSAEHGQWYCHNEQQWIHPQQLQQGYQQQPQQAYQQPPQQAYQQQPPGKSRRGLFIGLALAAGAGILALVLILTLGGGSDGASGADSAEALAESTLRAIEKEDVATLVQLGGGPEMLATIADCPSMRARPDDLYMEAALELPWRRRLLSIDRDQLALEKVVVPDEPKSKGSKGEKVFDDCVAVRDFASYEVELQLAADGADRVLMSAMEVDGHWYLGGVRGLPERRPTAEERDAHEEYARKLRTEVREKRRAADLSLPATVGAADAKGTIDKAVKAMNEGDAGALKSLTPQPWTVELVFDCALNSQLLEELMMNERSAEREIERRKQSGDSVEIESVEVAEEKKLAVGDELMDCKVARETDLAVLDVSVRLGGTSRDRKFEALRINNRWFLLP